MTASYKDFAERLTQAIDLHTEIQNGSQLAANVSGNARQIVVNDIINLMEIMHESAKDRHNHWLVAAQLIRAEFGGRDDDKTR